MRHDTQRLHPCKVTRLQAKTAALRHGTGRIEAGFATCRTDMVNFANALHGLTDNEKIKLFRHQPTMLDWYEKVAYVTNSVTDFLQSAQTVNSYPAGTTNEEAKEEGA